jgi:hypothetical protein
MSRIRAKVAMNLRRLRSSITSRKTLLLLFVELALVQTEERLARLSADVAIRRGLKV